jgi:hypothetical protein
MTPEISSSMCRLEAALALLRETGDGDWHNAYLIAERRAARYDTGSRAQAHWHAVRDLIVVASHGAPDTLSYLDEDWLALIGETPRARRS